MYIWIARSFRVWMRRICWRPWASQELPRPASWILPAIVKQRHRCLLSRQGHPKRMVRLSFSYFLSYEYSGFCEGVRVWPFHEEVNASCFLPVLIPPSLIHIAPLGLDPCPVFCVAFPSLPLLRIISGAVAPDLFGKCALGLFLPVLLQLTFPHSDDSPSHGIERQSRQLVTPDVILSLITPWCDDKHAVLWSKIWVTVRSGFISISMIHMQFWFKQMSITEIIWMTKGVFDTSLWNNL